MDWSKVKGRVAALLNAQGGLLTAFAWNGGEYSGVRTNLRREDVATDAGLYDSNYAFSLLCPMGQFASSGYPTSRSETITIGGKVYRVLSTDVDSIEATVRLNLGDALS